MSLHSLLIIDYDSSTMVYQYLNINSKGSIKEDTKLIVGKIKALKCKVGERERLKGDAGNWYVTRGESNLMYAACAGEGYPERTAYGLIQKIETLVQGKSKVVEGAEKKIKSIQKEVNTLCEKYKDSTVDKVK